MAAIGGLLVLVWDALLPNRVRKLLASCAYLAAIFCGVATVWSPPRSIEGVLGSILTTSFGLLYLVGGVLSLSTVFLGWWWAERAGIASIMVGSGLYLIVVLSLQFSAESGSRLSQYWAIFVALPLLAYRMHDIWRHPYEPRPHSEGEDE